MFLGKILRPTAMKNLTLIVLFILSVVCVAQAQFAESETIISDEFHFIAFFPNKPMQTEGDINTSFGKGHSRRWTLELPDISYEVSVNDFPDLAVEMDYKPLTLFYGAVCKDLINQYGGEVSGHTDIIFGEYGVAVSRLTKNHFLSVRMYLVRQRFYQVRVIMQNPLEKDEQTKENVKNFMEKFIFVYKKENEKKYSYGLPESVSQNLEHRKN